MGEMAAKQRLMDSDFLPDEMWTTIFTTGINKSGLDIGDISSISISSKRFNELSEQDALWSALLTHDFPPNADDKEGDEPSSKKVLYMIALRRRLKDELKSHQVGIKKIEQELMYYKEDWIEREADRRADMEEFLTSDQLIMSNNIPHNERETSEAVYRLRHTLSQQLKQVFEELLKMINTREPGAAFDHQFPSLESHSIDVDCSGTNLRYFYHITVSAQGKVKAQLFKQKSILATMKQAHSRINVLLHLQQEHGQKMEKIRSQLSLLASLLKIYDNDEEEEEVKEDANDEANYWGCTLFGECIEFGV